MEQRADLLNLLNYIPPSELDYQEWVNVGMALKYEGYTAADWDDWSRKDTARYIPGNVSVNGELPWGSFPGYCRYSCSDGFRQGMDATKGSRT